MNVQRINMGICGMHLIGLDTPVTLALSNVTGIQILLDLILAMTELHSDPIVALVDVLVNVLYGLDGCDTLDIDVAAVLPEQIWIVGNYPAIINLLPIVLKSSSSITTSENSIGVL
jgi:hypothetical protein